MENPQEELCSKCQKLLLPEARFCGSCGTAVPTEPEPEPEPETVPVAATTKASGNIVGGCIIMLIMAGGIIWAGSAVVHYARNQVSSTMAKINTATDAAPIAVTNEPQPQSGNVTINANTGKMSAPATNSKPSDSAAIRAFATKVKNNVDEINECQRSLIALMNKPLFGDANWTISMAVQISILDSLADEGLAISTDSQACKPALQLWHQAMNEYKFVTKHLPIALDSGSKNEYSMTVQHIYQATQYVVQALDMAQELAKSIGN